MRREEIISVITAALKKNKIIKKYRNYQNNKGVQILTNDDRLFNILTIEVVEKSNLK